MPQTPPRINTLLRRCLEKEPRQRVQAVGDVRLAMAGAFETTTVGPSEPTVEPQLELWERPLPLVVAGLLVAVVSSLGVWSLTRPDEPQPQPVQRYAIPRPEVRADSRNQLAISPDGGHLVYTAGGRLNHRPMDQLTATPLPGTRRLTVDEMRACDFGHRLGLGMVAGVVSGYRECWDFDDAETYEAFIDAAVACGLGDVVSRIRAGYEDETPRAGRRWVVEYPESVTWRDCTLARRPGDGKQVETLIELPTFAILAPSHGRTHPTGRPYIRLSGGFDTIASYSEAERDALVVLAQSFDEMPRRQHVRATPAKTTHEAGLRPGDDFNARTSWADLLESHGWAHGFTRGDVSYWRRPEKPFGVSATSNFGGSDLFYVFSSSTAFEPDTSYSKFGAYALLEHGGDFHKAALALARQGFGQQDEAVSTPSAPAASSTPRTLAEVEDVFARWIPDDDPVPTRTVLATYVANLKLEGDPVWLMLVGGSGVGKTERITPLGVMPEVVLESSVTGPAALLSGTARKERTKDATGGLLRKIPEGGGLLVLKDFTSIIDMHRESRAEVLAAFREIHDGRWDRSIGRFSGRPGSPTAACSVASSGASLRMATRCTRPPRTPLKSLLAKPAV